MPVHRFILYNVLLIFLIYGGLGVWVLRLNRFFWVGVISCWGSKPVLRGLVVFLGLGALYLNIEE